jgi:hypothetical protein
MTDREQYTPGSGPRGAGTKGRRKVDSHSRQTTVPLAGKVWQSLTDPAHLREWAPFEVDGSPAVGTTVNLTRVGTPTRWRQQ